MPVQQIIILGGGIAGLSAALALTKLRLAKPELSIQLVTVYEIRASPSTIGGAINLTPNALRYLDHLGVLPKLVDKGCLVSRIDILAQRTGKKLGALCFTANEQSQAEHGAMRVQRGELLEAILATASEAGIDVRYGMKATTLGLSGERARVRFEGGTVTEADLVLGCDGIHSFVRSIVDPGRRPVYSGMATAYGIFTDDGTYRETLPIDTTGVWSGRRGSLLASWADPAKTQLYVAAVMETAEVPSREGWKVKGEDFESVKKTMLERFGNDAVPYLAEMIHNVAGFTLYPVYKLPPDGKWSSGSALLLGDAAHAMPPQGESLGLAIEDTILFTRVLERSHDQPTEQILEQYEKLRKPRIHTAFEEADWRWDTAKDKGWLANMALEWITGWYLWWKRDEKLKDFMYDVREIDLDILLE